MLICGCHQDDGHEFFDLVHSCSRHWRYATINGDLGRKGHINSYNRSSMVKKLVLLTVVNCILEQLKLVTRQSQLRPVSVFLLQTLT